MPITIEEANAPALGIVLGSRGTFVHSYGVIAMGSGLTIDNVLGPVFEGEDQQFWIPGVGPASCQMWDLRPDPFFLLGIKVTVTLIQARIEIR
jgi:hypothetical protein